MDSWEKGSKINVVGKKASESHVIVHENAFLHIPLELYPWSIAIQKGQFRYQYQVQSQLGNRYFWLLKDHPSNVWKTSAVFRLEMIQKGLVSAE